MTASTDDSITQWVRRFQGEREEAAARLWGAYESKLLALAARHLSRQARRVSDPEDVVASVFESFFECAAAGKIPADASRDDLWRLLSTIVQYKAINHARRELRQKRGGNHRFANEGDAERDLLAEFASRDLTPDVAAEVSDSVDQLLGLLVDEQQREIVSLKLQGFLDREIADQLKISVPTVERRLRLTRSLWRAWTDKQLS